MNFYSRPCGRGDGAPLQASRPAGQFLLTPLREGRPDAALQTDREDWISTHAPAGGATDGKFHIPLTQQEFLLTPLREGRRLHRRLHLAERYPISTHAPAGGATLLGHFPHLALLHFYSRPCGRGDGNTREGGCRWSISTHAPAGGATDLDREQKLSAKISTHAPAGGATQFVANVAEAMVKFLLTPLREGRLKPLGCLRMSTWNFYSRPCGRGDESGGRNQQPGNQFLLTPLREGRPSTP